MAFEKRVDFAQAKHHRHGQLLELGVRETNTNRDILVALAHLAVAASPP